MSRLFLQALCLGQFHLYGRYAGVLNLQLKTIELQNQYILFAVIYAISTLLFFSVSSSKLPTYALAIFPALALIAGYFWWGYVSFDKYTKNIKISSLITFIILILAGAGGAILSYFPPEGIKLYMNSFQAFSEVTCIWFIVVPLIGCLCLIAKNRALLFITNVIFMLGVMFITTVHLFPMITDFGQRELEEFSNMAALDNKGAELVTFGFARKYSLMNNFDKKIIYIIDTTPRDINELNNAVSKKGRVYVIVKNETYEYFKPQGVFKNLKEEKKHKKYILLVK